MKYLIGVDVGTSATKTVLFDEECRQVAEASAEYPLYQPQNGWAEQDPKDWEEAAASTIREVMAKSRVDKEDVVGLGLSGQMHGLVMLNEANEVLSDPQKRARYDQYGFEDPMAGMGGGNPFAG